MNFKKLYSTKAKVFFLAGLLGGMTACKDVIEPEMPENQQVPSTHYVVNDEVSQNQDGFMKHLSDIDAARFYFGDIYIRFSTGADGNVNRFWAGPEEVDENNESISYAPDQEHSADRTYDFVGEKNEAFFKETDYDFCVKYQVYDPHESWGIYDVPQEVYFNYFQYVPDSTLARMAYERLTSVNADPGHINNIYNAILRGEGQWEQEKGVFKIASKGQETGMQHSDYGLLEEAEANPQDDQEAIPYMGGVESERSQTPSEPTKFRGRAYATISVKRDDICSYAQHDITVDEGHRIISTDSAAATFSHGNIADTLVMPFNNWYKVTVITQHSSKNVDVTFENYPSNSELSETQWGIHNNTQNSFVASDTSMSNGLDFYVYESGNPGAGISFASSYPLYYGVETGVATGLENVYCAPARKTKASGDSATPTEVVTQCFYTDLYTQDGKNKETEINFVFGGVKQNQR